MVKGKSINYWQYGNVCVINRQNEVYQKANRINPIKSSLRLGVLGAAPLGVGVMEDLPSV